MAYKEVSRVEITEIIRRWQSGESIRGLSRITGLARNTIRRYIIAAGTCGLTRNGLIPTEPQMLSLVQLNKPGHTPAGILTDKLLESHVNTIQHWIQEDKLRLTRIQELLKQHNCDIPYTSLRRYVIRMGWHRNTHTTVRMADTAPGEVAEMDFGRLGLVWDSEQNRMRVVWGMMIVLSYSRHSFLWPMFGQKLNDVIEGLEACWAFFGGIPRYLVIDNFPVAVAGPDAFNPRLTRGFLEYAQHRGFFTDPARVRHPKDKPKVENGINYARARFFKGGQFHDITDLRTQAKHWCLQVAGQRVHGTTQKLPLVVFQEEEKNTLLPWDAQPYEVPEWRTVTVHPDHHVAYRYALYSVPYNACPPGTKLEIKGDSKLIRLFHRGLLVKVHLRQPRGGRSTDPSDYPPELTPYTLRSPNHMRDQLATLGAAIGDFGDRLLSGPLPWSKIRQAQKLLRMGERYTPARLNAACIRALAVDLIDVQRLERILIEALETEAIPAERSFPAVPGRFVRPGTVFAASLNQSAGGI